MDDIQRTPETVSVASYYSEAVQRGFEGAQAAGFDLALASNANYGANAPGRANAPAAIVDAMGRLAQDAELDAEFLLDPAHFALFAAIADSLLDNERAEAEATEYQPGIARERNMLGGLAYTLAGVHSGIVRDAISTEERQLQASPGLQEKAAEAQRKALDRQAFLDSINNVTLAEQVQRILAATGHDAFLDTVHAKLGLTGEDILYTVKVLNVARSYQEYLTSRHYKPIKYPKREQFRPGRLGDRAFWRAHFEVRDAEQVLINAAQPYIDAWEEYNRRFASDFGPLPVAYVKTSSDGSVELVIRAKTAQHLVDSWGKDPVLARTDPAIQHSIDVVRHEAAHLSKPLCFGLNWVLGCMLEEAKAITMEQDGGYLDIQWLFEEIGHATGADIQAVLLDALQDTDPLQSFVLHASHTIGLRAILLLVASRPLYYDNFPSMEAQCEGIGSIKNEHDVSRHDALVRELVERHGDQGYYDRILSRIAADAIRGVSREELLSEASCRNDPAIGGLAFSEPYIARAIQEVYGSSAGGRAGITMAL